jgi:hypothetical protein
MIRIQHPAQRMAPWPSGSKQPPAEQDEIFCFCVEKNLHGQGEHDFPLSFFRTGALHMHSAFLT